MASKRYSVDINGTRETVQTFNVWSGDGARNNTLHVRMVHGAKVELVDTQTRTAPKSIRAKRVGSDLHVALPDGDIGRPDLVIDNYFAKGQAPGQLIGRDAKGQYFNFGNLSSGQVADNATVTASLGGKAVSPWGNVADAPVVMSETRAGLGDVDPAPPPSTGKVVAATGGTATATPAASPTPVSTGASTAGGKAAVESSGMDWGTVGWVALGVGGVGLIAAGGGGGDSSSTSTAAPAPAPSPTPVTPSAPTIQGVTPASATATEGDTVTFAVQLSSPSTKAETYALKLVGSGSGSADINAPSFTQGVQYDATAGTVKVPAGVAAFNVTVSTKNDTVFEQTEKLSLSIGGTTSADVSVADNDTRPAIQSIAGAGAVAEGQAAVFSVTLSGQADAALTHALQLGGTASANDYGTLTFDNPGVTFDAATSQITVAAGVTSFKISIQTSSDTQFFEPSETITLTSGTVSGSVTVTNVGLFGNQNTLASVASAGGPDVVTLSDGSSVAEFSAFQAGTGGDLIDVTSLLGSAHVVQATGSAVQALAGNNVVLLPVDGTATAEALAQVVATLTVDAGSKQVFALEDAANPQSARVFLAQDANGDHRLDAAEIHQIAQIAFSAGSTAADLDASNFIVQPVMGG